LIDAMPRKLPPFVYRERTRHGRDCYYFRRDHGPRTRLPELGAPDFEAAYHAALTGKSVADPAQPDRRSLAWLIAQYRQSAAFLALSLATRRQRDNIFRNAQAALGDAPFAALKRSDVVKIRDKRAATPAQARNVLDALRGLYRWALEAQLVQLDPTAGVKNPPRPKGSNGFPVWTQEEVEQYFRRWPAGTRQHVWLAVLLYTGLRRGDAVRIGWQHVRGNVAQLRSEKTDAELTLPIFPELAAALNAGPTGDLAWICGEAGRPLTKESFGNLFKQACRAAGIAGKSSHGVRKAGATFDAEAGLSVAELEARYGWHGGSMASHYTKSANRKALALQAAAKIAEARQEKRKGNK
jgi:integrase